MNLWAFQISSSSVEFILVNMNAPPRTFINYRLSYTQIIRSSWGYLTINLKQMLSVSRNKDAGMYFQRRIQPTWFGLFQFLFLLFSFFFFLSCPRYDIKLNLV